VLSNQREQDHYARDVGANDYCFIRNVSPEPDQNEERFPDEDWDRRPMLAVREKDRGGRLAWPVGVNEIPLVVKEVLVTREIEERRENDRGQSTDQRQ
jgi:hypothetical protein